MAWLLRWIHYRPGHTGASYLPEATGSQQITYNLVLLPVPKGQAAGAAGRDVDPAQALRKAPRVSVQ